MNTQHTPGPWTKEFDTTGGHRVHVLNAGLDKLGTRNAIGHFTGYSQEPPRDYWKLDNEINEANARLIAAAPDLLAALEALLWTIGPCADMAEGRLDMARKALAKAKGE